MSFSDALEGEILDWVFNIGTPSAVTQGTHLAVFTASPENDADTTTNGFAETDFNRVDCQTAGNGGGDLFTRTNDQVWNNETVTFTNDSGSQQTITHIALVNGGTGAAGIVAHAALQTSRDVPDQADLEFAGDNSQGGAAITFTLD